MNPADFDARLRQAVSRTMETMAFAEVEPDVSGGAPVPPDALLTRIAVLEPMSSTLILAATRPFLAEIGETILTLPEAEISEQASLDLLSELLNTLAGCLMTLLLPADQSFRLGLPEPLAREGLDLQDLSAWPFTVNGKGFCLFVNQSLMDQI